MAAIFALLTGTIAGFAFGILRLPIPAPPTLAGILGIVGLTIGYRLATLALTRPPT